MFVFVFFNKSSCKGLFSLASGSVHIVVVWHSAELWRVRGVTEWVHNASECFLLTYWQLFSWKTSPKERESDPTERNCPAGGTSWDTVNGTWERELKLVQHGDVWMEYQICVIDISKATERWEQSHIFGLRNWDLTVKGSGMKDFYNIFFFVQHVLNIQHMDVFLICNTKQRQQGKIKDIKTNI